jgi:hypothetical protein
MEPRGGNLRAEKQRQFRGAPVFRPAPASMRPLCISLRRTWDKAPLAVWAFNPQWFAPPAAIGSVPKSRLSCVDFAPPNLLSSIPAARSTSMWPSGGLPETGPGRNTAVAEVCRVAERMLPDAAVPAGRLIYHPAFGGKLTTGRLPQFSGVAAKCHRIAMRGDPSPARLQFGEPAEPLQFGGDCRQPVDSKLIPGNATATVQQSDILWNPWPVVPDSPVALHRPTQCLRTRPQIRVF